MKTFTISARPYYHPIGQSYQTILTLNGEPQGPLNHYVRRLSFPPLSPYHAFDTNQSYRDKCGYALMPLSLFPTCSPCGLKPHHHPQPQQGCLMSPDQLPDLLTFLLANGYQIETHLTNMLNASPVKPNQNQLLMMATYYGDQSPNIMYTR